MSDDRPTSSSSEPVGLIRLLQSFIEHQVDFVVCGGVACVLHGVARVTNDIDLAIDLSDENVARVVEAVRELGFTPRVPEPLEALRDPARRQAWIREKNAKVFTVVSGRTPLQIDLFLDYPIPFADLKAKSVVMTSGDLSFHVSSKMDLIDAKRQVDPMRSVDRRDIEDLQELMQREQDES